MTGRHEHGYNPRIAGIAAMPRLQDVLFVLLAVAVALLLAYDFQVGILALTGAFLCGCFYLFAGMIPPRTDSFWGRLATTLFLAIVISCIVLIVPGTFGAARLGLQGPVLAIAVLLPLAAICFEVVRTPHLLQAILRSMRWR